MRSLTQAAALIADTAIFTLRLRPVLRPSISLAKSKRDAVLRLLRGEDLDTVSRESKVTAAKLTEWREAFLASGMAGLKARETDARDEEIERLKAVLGEMTMRCELQRDAIRRLKAGLPLDETRLPK